MVKLELDGKIENKCIVSRVQARAERECVCEGVSATEQVGSSKTEYIDDFTARAKVLVGCVLAVRSEGSLD